MENFSLSVVVTVYNKASTLKRCIASILKNKSKNYEIVIINDGSTDESQKIIEKYKSFYSHISVYHLDHVGISAIRKNVTSYISGKYMLFVDADDTINEELISKLEDCINIYEPDIIKYDVQEKNSVKDENRYILRKDKVYKDGKEALKEWHDKDIRYGLFGMYCFKTEIYQKSSSHFCLLDCYDDVANIPKILYFSKRIVSIDYIGYNYYRTKNSITLGGKKDFKFLQFQKAYDNLIEFFKENLKDDKELYSLIWEYYTFHLNRKRKECFEGEKSF